MNRSLLRSFHSVLTFLSTNRSPLLGLRCLLFFPRIFQKTKLLQKNLSLNVIHGHDKGLVLIAALALIAILAIVSTAAVYTTTTDIRISGNYKTSVQAFYLAEAGIHDGIGQLRNGTISDSGAKTNPDWNVTATYSSSPYAASFPWFNHSFTVTHQVIGSSIVTDDGGTPLFLISSTGTSSTSIKRIEAVVRLVYALPFTKALEGCDGVTISGSAFTDSFDSALGSYISQVIPDTIRKDAQNNAWARDRGNVGTANAGADVIIQGNAQIHGNAKATQYVTTSGTGVPTTGLGTPPNLTGYTGTPDTNNNAIVYGIPTENNPPTPCDPLDTPTLFEMADDIVTINNNAEIVNLPQPPFPPNKPYDTTSKDFDLPANGTSTLGIPGQTKNYYFDDFDLNSNSYLYIDGMVTIFVGDDFTTASNSDLELKNNASLAVYVTGSININSNSFINPGAPADLMIYSSASSSSDNDYKVTLSSNSDFVGNVYAPNAAIKISSNYDIMGAIKGKYIECSSNAKFHYDEALGRLEGYPVLSYEIISWREIN